MPSPLLALWEAARKPPSPTHTAAQATRRAFGLAARFRPPSHTPQGGTHLHGAQALDGPPRPPQHAELPALGL